MNTSIIRLPGANNKCVCGLIRLKQKLLERRSVGMYLRVKGEEEGEEEGEVEGEEDDDDEL